MAFERFAYGNPLQILLMIEARTCKGCKFEIKDVCFGKTVKACSYILKDGKNRVHKDKRCKYYRDE